MSKLETPVTEGFWKVVAGGTYMAEYPLVRKSLNSGCRLADAVILPNEPRQCLTDRKRYLPLSGHDVIVVQTKVDRMGMYLMGQALFSARLALAARAASVRSILLCRQADATLLPLLAPFPEVEVWLYDPEDRGRYLRVESRGESLQA